MDAPRDPNPSGDDPQHRMPRWVKAFVIAGVAVTLVVIAVLTLSGGGHGPGRHLPGGDDGAVETPDGHQPPPGMDH